MRTKPFPLFMFNIVLVTDLQSGGTSGSNSSNGGGTPSSPVLRIIIDNMFYPVTLDVLQQVWDATVWISLLLTVYIGDKLMCC